MPGHGRVTAAVKFGRREVPETRVTRSSAPEERAVMPADTTIARAVGWDMETLAADLRGWRKRWIWIPT